MTEFQCTFMQYYLQYTVANFAVVAGVGILICGLGAFAFTMSRILKDWAQHGDAP